jgi:hypothetical protein
MPDSFTTRRRLLAATATAAAFVAPGAAPAPSQVPGPEATAFQPTLFRSFFLGGFECSTHYRTDGRRHDLIAATRHDALAEGDYRQLAEHGVRAARDGLRWHLVEAGAPGHYDWSSVLPMLRAAETAGTQVAWDLCHYGWPDGLDPFSAAFADRLARYAAAFRTPAPRGDRPRAPGLPGQRDLLPRLGRGRHGADEPRRAGRGDELKRGLARAAIAATHAVREAAPGTRVLAVDPLMHVAPAAGQDPGPAAAYAEAQFQAWDMLAGRLAPELGGGPETLDVVGVNYYWNNQREHGGGELPPGDPRRKPFRTMLAEAYARYGRPIFVAETSIEGEARASWLRHVGEEARAAVRAGVPLEGICLYPVLSHPGWDDDRYCPNGLFEMEVTGGRRVEHAPLADELRRQRDLFEALFSNT